MELTSDIYVFGEVRLDVSNLRLTVSGELRPLEPKSFRLLQFLVENRHRVVPKEEILTVVWEGTAVSDNALTRAIAQIRKALDDDPRQPRYIETVQTVGYRFLATVDSAPTELAPAPVAPLTPRNPSISIARPVAGLLAGVFVGCAVFAVVLAFVHFHEKPLPPPDLMRFQIRLPEGVKFETSGTLTFAPDGRHVAFPAITSEGYRIFVQDLNGGASRELTNTRISNASPPLGWSPDSAYIAYSAAGTTVSKVQVASGVVTDVCVKPGPAIGGAWNRDGTLIFGSTNAGLWRVPAAGGTATRLTRLNPSRRETAHALPMFLPDGKHYLFFSMSAEREKSGIFARSLDDAIEKPSNFVVATEFGARFVAGPDPKSGWLLYLRDGALLAQPFDAVKLSLTGSPSPLPAKVGTAFQTALFSASPSALVYRDGEANQRVQLTWVDGKTGKNLGTAGEPGIITSPRLSPDERRVAYLKDGESLQRDVWVLDLERGSSTRLTFGGTQDEPVWSPDSSEVAYSRRLNDGTYQIFKTKADGSGPEEPVLKLPREQLFPADWSRDGRFLIFKSVGTGPARVSLSALPLGKNAAPIRLSGTGDFSEGQARLSPDGHYLAYYSNETGRFEIYVRTFAPDPGPQPAGKWAISNNGGMSPEWSADGKKLVWNFGQVVYAASIDTARGFHAGVPERLYSYTGSRGHAATLTSKGQGLLLKPVDAQADEPMNVLVNWTSAIKRD